MKKPMFLALWTLLSLGYSLTCFAQERVSTGASARPEFVGVGEVRLDGRITAVMSESLYSLEITSFTSPRGVTRDLEAPRTRIVAAQKNCWLHKRQPPQSRLPLSEIKLGSFVAVIGKDDPVTKHILAREIVLFEKAMEKISAGSAASVSQLVKLAREAAASGKAAQAQDYFNQALASAKSSRNRVSESFVLRDIANFHAEAGADAKALEFYAQAATISAGAGDARGQATAYYNQGQVYERSGRRDLAKQALAKAEKLAAESDARLWASILYLQLAGARQSGNEAEQVRVIRSLITLEDKAGDIPQVTDHKLALVQLLLKTQKTEAEALLAEVRKTLDVLPQTVRKSSLTARVASLLWSLKRKDEAAVVWEKAATMADASGAPLLAVQIRGVSRLQRSAEKVRGQEAPNPIVQKQG